MKKMELEFLDSAENICEAFGVSVKTYSDLVKSMTAYFVKVGFSGTYNKKTDALEGYLKTEDFKKFGILLDNANAFFMLGYAFQKALDLEDKFTGEMANLARGAAEKLSAKLSQEEKSGEEASSSIEKMFQDLAGKTPEAKPKKLPGIN